MKWTSQLSRSSFRNDGAFSFFAAAKAALSCGRRSSHRSLAAVNLNELLGGSSCQRLRLPASHSCTMRRSGHSICCGVNGTEHVEVGAVVHRVIKVSAVNGQGGSDSYRARRDDEINIPVERVDRVDKPLASALHCRRSASPGLIDAGWAGTSRSSQCGLPETTIFM